MQQDHASPIQPAGPSQMGIHRSQPPTAPGGVEDQPHTAQQQTAHGEGMASEPMSNRGGRQGIVGEGLGSFGIAAVASIPAVMQTVQPHIGGEGPGQGPAE